MRATTASAASTVEPVAPAGVPDPRVSSSATTPNTNHSSAHLTPRLGRAARWLGRAPVTLTAVVALLTIGVLTQTLWRPTDPDSGLLRSLSFGVPSVQSGSWWTFLTGAFVLPRPEFYFIVVPVLLVGLRRFERRVGGLRAVIALLGTQVAGTVGAALLLWPFDNRSWPWAAALANQVDLGLSAGAIGVAAAGTALLSPVWRERARAAGLMYLGVLVLRSGLLWDVEHLFAFVTGILAGPALTGRPYHFHLRRPRIGGLRARTGVALLIAAAAVANLVDAVYPGPGGVFGAGRPSHPPMHAAALLVGELLVVLLVADALRRGRAAAWWLATVGAAAALANYLLNTRHGIVHLGDVLCAAAVLALLVTYRNAWSWRAPDGFARRSLRRVAVAVLTWTGIWMAMLWIIRGHLDAQAGVLDLARETLARLTYSFGPLRAGDGLARTCIRVATALWSFTLIGLLVPWLYADRGPERSPREIVGQLLRRHGGGSLGWMRTWPAFTSWTSRDGQVAISYCVVGTVAIAIGDPVGPQAQFPQAVRQFRQFCAWAGWTPCWFAATPALVAAAPGWRSTQIGEDTVIDLPTLEFVGKSWQDVRTARNRATREGITMRMGRLADFPAELRERIEAISTEWVSQKALPEMGFTLGTVDHALDPEMRTHLAMDADGRVQGVTTWLPVHHNGEIVGWTLDLMRRRPDGFRPVMEYLIAESALAFKAEGYQAVSLSVAPLARRTRPTGRRTALDRALDLLSGLLEPTYGFQSLLAFKAKFHPEFRPVYLVYAGPADLALISLAIGRAYLPHLDTKQAAQLLRGLRHSHCTIKG